MTAHDKIDAHAERVKADMAFLIAWHKRSLGQIIRRILERKL